MRNPWQNGNNGDQGRGKSRRSSTGRSGSIPSSSPFDFDASEENSVDPIDMLSIRADDELLDALASGRPVGTPMLRGNDTRSGGGFADDQHILAMLQDWRAEIDSEPFPELMTTDEAVRAISDGQRGARPRRRLMPVAAAAAVAVLAMSGVGVAASSAEPGDALWGISRVMNGQRAQSLEAEQRVQVALASAQTALAEGRVEEARATLQKATPDLAKVKDTERRDELLDKNVNLQASAFDTPEGEKVETDDKGHRRDDEDPGRDRHHGGSSDPSSADNPDRDKLGAAEREQREQARRERARQLRATILGQIGNPSDPSKPGDPNQPPVTGYPGSGSQPTTGQPTTGQPTTGQPTTHEPTGQQPGTSTPPSGGPTTGQPSQGGQQGGQEPPHQRPTPQPDGQQSGGQQPGSQQPGAQQPGGQPNKPAPGEQQSASPKPTPTAKPTPKPTPEPKPTAQPSKTESKPTADKQEDKPSHTKPVASRSEQSPERGEGRGESAGGRDHDQGGGGGGEGRGESGGSRGGGSGGGGDSGGGGRGGHSEGTQDTPLVPQQGGTALDTPPGQRPGVGSSI